MEKKAGKILFDFFVIGRVDISLSFALHKRARWLFLPFFLSTCFCNCSNPIRPDNAFVPWDTSFVIGKIKFPNDTMYNRALTSAGSNWRMHRFIDKCKAQKTIKIGFVGGSITAGATTSAQNLRFSSLFCSSIKGVFPDLENVIEINAGIGGTTSRFGCSRANSDLLSFSPDLIVVEFAVNDSGVGDAQYIRSTCEGLIRQCLLYKNDVPTILLFMARGDGTNVQALHADVGSYYNLPMISYRDAIWPLIESDWHYWNTFFYNDPHPNDTGHKVCAYLLYSYLKNSLNTPEDAAFPVPHFLYSDLYQNADIMFSADTVISVLRSNWQLIPKEKGRVGFSSSINFDSLTFQAKCDEMTLVIEALPTDTSSIHVVVDNGVVDTILTNYFRAEHQIVPRLYTSSLVGTHTVRIQHLKNGAFNIGYVLYARLQR